MDVVANDAGDRVTPAVVAYSGNEEVILLSAIAWRTQSNVIAFSDFSTTFFAGGWSGGKTK